MEQAGDEIAAIVASSSSTDEVNDKLTTWTTETQLFEPLGDVLFVTTALADMAGQLMVAGRETGVVQLADNAPSPKPFLDLPWADALEYFKARGLVKATDFETLLQDYAQRSAVARQLMLAQVQSEVMRHLADSIEQGGTFPEFAKQVNTLTDNLGLSRGKPSYLQMVFRTNVQSAYGAGRYKAMTNPVVANARPYVQYRTVGDARVRDEHAALDGKTYRTDDPVWERVAPPNGYNCFPGDTLVQGKFSAAVRALYTGQLVQLTTKAGCTLAITPNHPVLTADGFVAAASIRKGQHVLTYNSGVNAGAIGDVNPEDAPAEIEKVFHALAVGDGSPVRLGVRADDFHSDAQFFDGHIDVVTADRQLLRAAQPQATNQRSDFGLPSAHAGHALTVGGSAPSHLSITAGAPDSGAPRVATLASDGGGVLLDALPFQPLSFGPAAHIDATRYKDALNDAAADIHFIGDLLDRYAGSVSADEVVSVQLQWFHGYVYDLESPNRGWIVAGGIFTSNCRCSMVTLSSEDAEGLEISTDIPIEYEPTPGFDQPPTATLDVQDDAADSDG